jgi:hypothetical protein
MNHSPDRTRATDDSALHPNDWTFTAGSRGSLQQTEVRP